MTKEKQAQQDAKEQDHLDGVYKERGSSELPNVSDRSEVTAAAAVGDKNAQNVLDVLKQRGK